MAATLLTMLGSIALASAPAAQDSPPSRPSPQPPSVAAPSTQPTTAPAPDLPSAAEVVAASIDAIGGKANADAVTSVAIKIDLSEIMGDTTADLWSDREGRFLYVMPLGDQKGELRLGFDGSVGWIRNPANSGGFEILTPDQLVQTRQQFAALSYWFLFDLNRRVQSVEAVERVQFQTQECVKLRLIDASADAIQIHAYYRVSDHMLQGIEMNSGSKSGSQIYDAWKDIDGLRVFSEVRVEEAGVTQRMKYSEIVFNSVEAGAFELPPEVQTLVTQRESPATTPATAPATQPENTRP